MRAGELRVGLRQAAEAALGIGRLAGAQGAGRVVEGALRGADGDVGRRCRGDGARGRGRRGGGARGAAARRASGARRRRRGGDDGMTASRTE